MASFTLTKVQQFPNGTSVGAYPVSGWREDQLPPTGAALGSATNSQTMTSGTLTFTGLTAGVDYFAGKADGTLGYVRFTAGADQTQLGAQASDVEVSDAIATHAALTSGAHGITAAAATVLDDTTVAAMRATLAVARDFGIVTSLPGSPVTGDRCVYTDSLTVPTYHFNLVYLSTDSGSYKWQVVGGRPMLVSDDTSRATTSTTYASLTSPLALTLPLAGDWDLTVGGKITTNNSGEFAYISYAVGGTAASDNWAIAAGAGAGGAAANAVGGQQKANRHTGLAASTVLTEKARTTFGLSTDFTSRRLWAMPVRVG